MKFGISTSYIEVDFFDELKKICSKFSVVELALSDIDIAESTLREIISILAENETKSCIHAPIIDVNLCSPNEGIRKESIRQAKACIDIAKRLNSNPVNLHFGRMPTFSASFEEIELISKEVRQEYFNFGLKSLREILDYTSGDMRKILNIVQLFQFHDSKNNMDGYYGLLNIPNRNFIKEIYKDLNKLKSKTGIFKISKKIDEGMKKGYYTIGNHYVEVSYGHGSDHNMIYGITVLNLDGLRCMELDKCVFSKKEIIEHCNMIREID